MPKIEKMFAFIAEETPNDEGVIAMSMPNGTWMPLVGADMARVESLRRVAQDTATRTGKNVILIEFSVRKDLETIKPKHV